MRKIFLSVTTAVLLLVVANPAFAGNWAITELDEPLPDFVAGETYEIGFTILQHGETPVAVQNPGIRIVGEDGSAIFYPAEPVGPIGHYVATLTFSKTGTWVIEIEQGVLANDTLHFEPFIIGQVEFSAADKAPSKVTPVKKTPPTTIVTKSAPTTLAPKVAPTTQPDFAGSAEAGSNGGVWVLVGLLGVAGAAGLVAMRRRPTVERRPEQVVAKR